MSKWTTPVTQPFSGQQIPAFLHGVITPMFTPCRPDGSLDEAAIRSYTDYLIDMGSITALFPRCGLGRMYAFDYDEVKQIIDIVVDQAADRMPVMPGTSGVYDGNPAHRPDPDVFIRQGIELSQHAQKCGAAAVVLVLPAALAPVEGVPLEDTICEYFAAIGAEIDLPIVMYQAPGLPEEYLMTPSLLQRLLTLPNVAGMKYSSGEMVRMARLAMAAEGTNFAFIAGDEIGYLFAITLGASGVIGQGCNTNPEILRAVYDRMWEKDIVGAREALYDSYRAIEVAEGTDCVISGLLYAARKGAHVQGYTKRHGSPYGGSGGSVSEERMDRYEREMDALRAKYRT